MDVTQLLRAGGAAEQPTAVTGYISTSRPAPASFVDPVWVMVPEFSIDYAYGPCDWPAIHGATLPAQGAKALLLFDQNNAPTVVSWQGVHS